MILTWGKVNLFIFNAFFFLFDVSIVINAVSKLTTDKRYPAIVENNTIIKKKKRFSTFLTVFLWVGGWWGCWGGVSGEE